MSTSKAIIIGISDCDEKICAASGRISTQEGNCSEILERSQDKEKNANLISKVTRSGHNSTVEHIMFNIAFQDVSAVVEQFMIEFRLASFTVKSRRYVDFSTMGYYVPDFDDSSLTDIYKEHMSYLFSEYQYFLESGIQKEDARFILPYCLHSNFYCSLNGREFLNVLRAMIYGRGSKYPEIYALGQQLLEQARKKTPGIFIDFEERSANFKDDLSFDFIDLTSFEKDDSENLCELLSLTPYAERCIAENALIYYSQLDTDNISKILENPENVKKIIAQVVKSSRPRPLESANFTFRLNNVSLPCITHFVRHRMQSINIPPLTKADRTKHITPKAIEENVELKARYDEAFKRNAELYKDLKDKGIKEELLVYFLLSGNTLDLVTTINARELMLMFRLRTCTRAQWEIREYAIEMLNTLRKVAPDIFNLYGPSCYVNGACPEGGFTCGRANEMKEFFKAE